MKENKSVVKDTTKKKKKKRNPWVSLLTKIVTIILIVVALYQFVGEVHVIHDNYMYPKVVDGDLVVTYKLDKLHSSDVIVYKIENKAYIGRVVAVEGDTIDFSETGYTVNGLNPYEVIFYPTDKIGNLSYPYTLKEGEVFVLCDYREQGTDSRTFGPITDIHGKVVLLLRGRGF